MFVPKLPLVDLIGGQLTGAIEQLGVEVKRGKLVRQISTDKNVTTADGEVFAADHVVAAVPWHAVNDLVPDKAVEKLECLAVAPTSPISGLHLWFDRQITDLPHAVLVGTVAQWVFRQPWEDKQASPGFYYQVVISASQSARCLPQQELIEIVLGELRVDRHAFIFFLYAPARAARCGRRRMCPLPLSTSRPPRPSWLTSAGMSLHRSRRSRQGRQRLPRIPRQPLSKIVQGRWLSSTL